MHIYHYAPYEKTALLRLAGRYGVGEDEVDDLLRNGVLVDLYPLVRKSIRVGTENYSLKSLEPLYMGSELRTGDVTTATDSITAVRAVLRAARRGRDDEAAGVLKEIERLQPLRLPLDTQAARLADQTGRSNAVCRRWVPNLSPMAPAPGTTMNWPARSLPSPAIRVEAAPRTGRGRAHRRRARIPPT